MPHFILVWTTSQKYLDFPLLQILFFRRGLSPSYHWLSLSPLKPSILWPASGMDTISCTSLLGVQGSSTFFLRDAFFPSHLLLCVPVHPHTISTLMLLPTVPDLELFGERDGYCRPQSLWKDRNGREFLDANGFICICLFMYENSLLAISSAQHMYTKFMVFWAETGKVFHKYIRGSLQVYILSQISSDIIFSIASWINKICIQPRITE